MADGYNRHLSDMKCIVMIMEVMSSSICQVELGVHSAFVLSRA